MSISDLVITDPTNLEAAGRGAERIRETKEALKEAFPAVNGEINNVGALGGTGDTDPPDALTFTALFTRIRNLEAGTASVPLGAIMLWSEALNGNIPGGWTVCDGSGALNGISVPDFRDKFPIAAGTQFPDNDTPGGDFTTSLGGAGTGTATFTLPNHNIIFDNLPQHDHLTVSTGESTGPLSASIGIAGEELIGGSSGPNYQLKGKNPPDAGKTNMSGGVAGPLGLTHPETDITIDGIEHAHEAVPPHYALTYIIHVGT